VSPDLAKLQPYPFERLRLLFKDITPDPGVSALSNLSRQRDGPAGAGNQRRGLGRRNTSGGKPPADGEYSLYCAVIVKRLDAGTRAKTSINELLHGD
jgi:hypothetical protein